MSPTHTRRRGRLYRYYICARSIKVGANSCLVRSVAASEIESVVLGQVRRLLETPEIAARTIAACHELSEEKGQTTTLESDVFEALGRLDLVWDELFPAEQTRILRLLVEGIDVAPDGIDVRLRTGGVRSLTNELLAEERAQPAADGEPLTEEAAA